MFSKNFITLLNEAQFTADILASGITQIGKINYAKKGLYFTSFTSLSTGLERIGKLCLIVDFYLQNNKFPDDKILKNEIGHDLEKLYEKSKEIINYHNIKLSFLENLDDQIYTDILSILSRFAKGDRYSNINFLSQSKFQADPIHEWYTKVETILFDKRVSQGKKNSISQKAKFVNQMIGKNSSVLYFDEKGNVLKSIEEASFKTGLYEAVSKYRQLYIAQIIRYWIEILRELHYISIKKKSTDIPHFGEVFPIFYNEDSYLLTRKNFERIR
ncbi:MAG: hypothetical protein DI539_04255 [Flavobacterium psychrophilum]|nr:MAG: hypothetical protein DI539_04255 [Flavobacterium psychrophilum]